MYNEYNGIDVKRNAIQFGPVKQMQFYCIVILCTENYVFFSFFFKSVYDERISHAVSSTFHIILESFVEARNRQSTA